MQEYDVNEVIAFHKEQGWSDERISARLTKLGLDKPRSWGAATGEAVRSAVGQGVMFGFGDELEAGVRTAVNGFDNYEEVRDSLRRDQQSWANDNPMFSFATELGGGLAAGIFGAGKALGVKALQFGLPSLAKMIGVGAAEGGVSAIGHSNADDIGTAATETAVGSAIGAVAGGVGYPISRGLQSIASRGPADKTSKEIRKAFERAGINDEEVAIRELDRAGLGGVIADIEGMTQSFRPAAQRPGPGRTTAESFMNNRMASMPERMMSFAKRQTGIEGTPTEYLKHLEADRLATAHRNYDPIMRVPVNATEPVIRSLETKAGGKAFRDASDKYFMQTGTRVTKESAADMTDLRFWNYYQSHLGGIMRSSKDKTRALRVREMRNEVNGAFDDQLPDFKNARRIYAEGLRIESAVEHGRKVINDTKIYPKDVENIVSAMDQQEKNSFLKGVMSALEIRALSRPETSNTALNVLRRPGTRDKILAAFDGDIPKADSFIAKLKEFAKQGETASDLMFNSNTAAKLAEQDARGELVDMGVDLAQGNTGSLVNAGVRGVGNFIKGRPTTAQDANLVNGMLQGGDPAREQIRRAFQSGQMNPYLAGAMPGMGAPAGGMSVAPPDPVGDVLRNAGIAPEQHRGTSNVGTSTSGH